jgi:hypothetical protein
MRAAPQSAARLLLATLCMALLLSAGAQNDSDLGFDYLLLARCVLRKERIGSTNAKLKKWAPAAVALSCDL